jgi:xanthine dehydrogenase accessory factor
VRSHEFAERVRELAARRLPFAMATVVRTEGSTLAKRGFKILISHDGQVVGGTFGGGCPEGPIVAVAEEAMRTGESRVVRVHLVDATESLRGMVAAPGPDEIFVETNCGGTLEVHVEPMLPSERLVLVGQGGRDDVEEALVRLGRELEFEVVVVDPNPQLGATADRVVVASLPDPAEVSLGERDSVVVLTKGERDVAILSALARAHPRYVGLLASRHRVQKNRSELEGQGVSPAFLTSLHAPIGLDIGAKSPSEIALAILAEVVAAKYGKTIPRAPPSPTETGGAPGQAHSP